MLASTPVDQTMRTMLRTEEKKKWIEEKKIIFDAYFRALCGSVHRVKGQNDSYYWQYKLVGALSPVNHRGLHQGYWQYKGLACYKNRKKNKQQKKKKKGKRGCHAQLWTWQTVHVKPPLKKVSVNSLFQLPLVTGALHIGIAVQACTCEIQLQSLLALCHCCITIVLGQIQLVCCGTIA